jgi:hypothetical protein
VSGSGVGLRFPLRFRLWITRMIRTEDDMRRNVGESQALSWFWSYHISGCLNDAPCPPLTSHGASIMLHYRDDTQAFGNRTADAWYYLCST